MKKRMKMKSLMSFLVLASLLFGLFIGGCEFMDKRIKDQVRAENAPIIKITDDIVAKGDRIEKEMKLWEENCLKYLQDLEDWERGMKDCKKTEISFIKNLDSKQLEIYSEYEESSKNNLSAKTELFLRKLQISLTDDKKNELFKISEIMISLEDRRKELNKRQIELTEQKKKLTYDYIENEKRRDNVLRYLSMRSNTPYYSSSSDASNSVQKSLERWQQSIQQQQQRMQIYSINQSLRDIASALRGY